MKQPGDTKAVDMFVDGGRTYPCLLCGAIYELAEFVEWVTCRWCGNIIQHSAETPKKEDTALRATLKPKREARRWFAWIPW